MDEKPTKRFWWLKLREDFFSQRAMRKLRKMAGGATYTIIYLKLQLLSLRSDGVILFEHVEDTFEEELALVLDEATEDVQMTLFFLRKHELIEQISNDEHMLAEAVLNIGSESYSAERMRNFRERKRLEMLHCDGESVTCDEEKS